MTALSSVSFTYNSNPSSTELEIKMLKWYGSLLNIPTEFHSNATTLETASEAMYISMLAAKCKIIDDNGYDKNDSSILSKLTLYASDQTHFW